MTRVRVLKFGGASLADGPAVRRSVDLVRAHGGGRPLVVVSAHQGVTRLLDRAFATALAGRVDWDPVRIRHRTILRQLELPGDLLDRHLRELRGLLEEVRRSSAPQRRLRDHVLSFGERMSARVFAGALRQAGIHAVPLDAFDLAVVSPGEGKRRLELATERVRSALEEVGGVPVVTGFLALDREGHLTTLGRNGSDLSAVWFASVLDAEAVHLWKTVPGLLTADPHQVAAPLPITAIGQDEAAELAAHGAEILHAEAIEPARRTGLDIWIRDVADPGGAGTHVVPATSARGPVCLAHRASVALYRVRFEPERDHAGQLGALFARLQDRGVEPYLCSASATDALVLLPDDPFADAAAADGTASATSLAMRLGDDARDRLETGWASFAVIGPGVGEDEALAREVDAALLAAGVDARPAPAAGTSARAWLTPAEQLTRALRGVHARLFERTPATREDATAALERKIPE